MNQRLSPGNAGNERDQHHQRMRICIITGIFPPDIGGPATYVPIMATALAQRGHAVVVITFSDRIDHDDTLYPFRIIRIPRALFMPRRLLLTLWTIITIGHHADILYVNGLHTEGAIANIWLRKPLIQKIVGDVAWERAQRRGWTTASLDDFQTAPRRPFVRYLAWLRAFSARQATGVVVPSSYLAKIVGGWGVAPERIAMIYNAIKTIPPPEPYAPVLPTPFTLVTVSRLTPWKHVDGILRAVAHFDDLGLVVVGDGQERDHLETLTADLGLTARVYFAGQRSLEDVHRFMAVCDAFVLNSSYEGLPHIVLEAMQLQLPVIATATGGTPEVVQHGTTGLLVPVGDDAALAAAIRTLRDDPALQARLTANATNAMQQQWSFDAMVTQTEHLLQHVRRGRFRGSTPGNPIDAS